AFLDQYPDPKTRPHPANTEGLQDNFFINPDLSLLSSTGWYFEPPAIRGDGLPIYDLSKARRIITPSKYPAMMMVPTEGNRVMSLGEGRSGFYYGKDARGYVDSKLTWIYP